MPLLAAGLTDIGQKRKTNQDAIFYCAEKNIFVVADGMGGHNAGDVASKIAVQEMPKYLSSAHSTDNPVQKMVQAIKQTNTAIYQTGLDNPSLKGMGTTVVALYFKGDTLYVGNVGDSRAYLINKKCLYQLSKDHSMVQEKINLGIYDREAGAKDPNKNVLVRTVGYEPNVQVDVFTYKVSRNDIFLICSDGLHGRVSEPDILHIINQHLANPTEIDDTNVSSAVSQLIQQANDNGGNDNISVIMVVAK